MEHTFADENFSQKVEVPPQGAEHLEHKLQVLQGNGSDKATFDGTNTDGFVQAAFQNHLEVTDGSCKGPLHYTLFKQAVRFVQNTPRAVPYNASKPPVLFRYLKMYEPKIELKIRQLAEKICSQRGFLAQDLTEMLRLFLRVAPSPQIVRILLDAGAKAEPKFLVVEDIYENFMNSSFIDGSTFCGKFYSFQLDERWSIFERWREIDRWIAAEREIDSCRQVCAKLLLENLDDTQISREQRSLALEVCASGDMQRFRVIFSGNILASLDQKIRKCMKDVDICANSLLVPEQLEESEEWKARLDLFDLKRKNYEAALQLQREAENNRLDFFKKRWLEKCHASILGNNHEALEELFSIERIFTEAEMAFITEGVFEPLLFFYMASLKQIPGDSDKIGILIAKRCDKTWTDEDANTFVHICAKKGATAIMEKFIKWNVKADRCNKFNESPLYAAAEAGQLEAAEVLLKKHGANLRIRSRRTRKCAQNLLQEVQVESQKSDLPVPASSIIEPPCRI